MTTKIPAKLKQYFSEGDPDEIFILEEEIASGSFGAVYKGRHFQTGKHYAVKIITPEEDEVLEDFMVEISVLKRCKHENIVGFYGSWLKGEELFIAMELCEGGAVSDIFSICQEPLTESQIAIVSRETLKAVVYLHSLGIIHRDIKGANILLTNSGDIKLVDFGVSAELKKPGERRNTLIGTPYWMAPEVVANKTGNQPYGIESDLWSLGITLIELAEMNPPLHEIHPMKALMMIPMRDPPTFQQPDKWSKEFRDFVNICLMKQPEKRKTAEEMLSHPFITRAKGREVLVDLINKRKKAEAAQMEDNDDDSDSSDSDLDDDDTPGNRGSSASEGHSFGSPFISPIGTPTNSIPVEGTPPASPSPGKRVNDGNGWQDRRPTTSNRGSTGILSQPHHHQPSPPQPRQTTQRKTTQRPGAANRPTYRTNKKLTKRDIKNIEKQIMSRQLLKEQLKEIRNMQQHHIKDQERQQRQQQKEIENIQSKYDATKQSTQKQISKDQEKMKGKQKSELDVVQKNKMVQQKNLQKAAQTSLRQHVKSSQNDSKQRKKEFLEHVKQQTKEHKAQIKQQKSLTKKDIKVLKFEHSHNLEWEDLKFEQEQTRLRQGDEYEKRRVLEEENAKREDNLLEKEHTTAWEHLVQHQKFQLDSHNNLFNISLDYLQQRQPLEIKHLQDRQELERQQLKGQLQIEMSQQNHLSENELKAERQQHKRAQQKVFMEMQQQLKQQAKDLPKKQLKQKQMELKEQLDVRFKKENAELEEKQQKQRKEESEMIQKHQQSKEVQQKSEHEDQLEKMKKEHEAAMKKLQEEHAMSLKEIQEKQKLEQIDLLATQQKELLDIAAAHAKQIEQILQDYHSEQTKLVEHQHQEQVQMNQRQQRDLTEDKRGEKRQELEKVEGEHRGEMTELARKQAAEMDVLQQKIKEQQHALQQQLTQQKNELERGIFPFAVNGEKS